MQTEIEKTYNLKMTEAELFDLIWILSAAAQALPMTSADRSMAAEFHEAITQFFNGWE